MSPLLIKSNTNTLKLSLESVIELKMRWQKARLAAITSIFPDLKSEDEFFESLKIKINYGETEKVLNQIFLNSKLLGQGYQRAYFISWQLEDFYQFIATLSPSCHGGSWLKKDNIALVYKRGGCSSGKKYGVYYCQYMREAVDGLIMGLSDQERIVRYSCVNTGQDNCEDVIYTDEEVPTEAIWSNQYRWGTIPEDKKEHFKKIESKFQKMKVKLLLLGVKENELFYKLEPQENLTCGSAGTLYRGMLDKMLKEIAPELTLKDASPIAILGEK